MADVATIDASNYAVFVDEGRMRKFRYLLIHKEKHILLEGDLEADADVPWRTEGSLLPATLEVLKANAVSTLENLTFLTATERDGWAVEFHGFTPAERATLGVGKAENTLPFAAAPSE